MRKQTSILGLLLLLLPLIALLAQTPPSPALELDSQIRSGQLDNGLHYFIRANHKPQNRAALRLAINAGSVLEGDDQQGLAHFLEHMAFNGTRHFEKQELVDFLEGIGMRFGPDLNAYTSFDETVYMLEVPLDDPAIFEKAFLVLQDWASAITLDPTEIDKERGVVKEEWRLGRGAQQRILDKQIPVLFHDSPYANRLPIGKPEIIDTAPPEAIRRFYQQWYRPNLMAVIAVGDFDDITYVENLVRKYFAPLSNPADAPTRPIPAIPDHQDTLFSIKTDPELPYTSVQIAYKRDASEDVTEADYTESLIDALANQMLNQRLNEKVQQADPPYLFAGVGESSLARSKEVYLQMAVVREDALDRGLTALLNEARRIQQDGFTQGELDRAKAETLRRYEQIFNERDKTPSAAYADELVRHFLTAEPAPGIAKELDIVRRALPAITLSSVNAAAQNRITPTNRAILYSAPDKPQLPVPTRNEIIAIVNKADQAALTAYDDSLSDEPLLPNLPEPGKITSEQFLERIRTTQWQLSNGARVILKPTDFKNDQILLRGFSHGGMSLIPDPQFIPAATAGDVIGLSGLGAFNLIDLQKKLAGKLARASASLGSQFQSVTAFAAPQDVETMFQLLYLRFTEPRADQDTFLSVQTRMREMIENRRNDPDAVFGDAVETALFNNHPRHQPLSTATLDGMNRETSLKIYQERFADASGFTFVIVGNFSPDKIKPLVERYLGGLPGTQTTKQGIFNNDDPVRGQHTITVQKGLEKKATIQILFTGDTAYVDDDRYALRAATDVLNIRLREALREDLGGTYGVRVSGGIEQWPKGTYSSAITFGCDPDRVTDLIDVALAEVERLQLQGPDPMNFAKVKEQHLREFEVNVRENPYWLNNLLYRAQNNLDLESIMDFPDKPKQLTPEKVAEAARKFFNSENRFIARLLPEPEAKP